MGNSASDKKRLDTNNKRFVNWLYYLKNGYYQEDYKKLIEEENLKSTDNLYLLNQIKKDVTALDLTVKSSNSFLNLTKNTIISYVIVLILFIIILSLNINILTNTACKVDTIDSFSNNHRSISNHRNIRHFSNNHKNFYY